MFFPQLERRSGGRLTNVQVADMLTFFPPFPHLLQERRHGGLDVRPGDLGLNWGVRDRLLGTVVERDDRLLPITWGVAVGGRGEGVRYRG